MAQADQTVQNATFPAVRADINNNLAALFTDSSGSTAPSVTVAFQDWIDTSGANPLWKKRNAANNAWITLGTLTASTVAFEGTLPSQAGNAGEYLTTDGTVASWGVLPTEVKAWVNFNGTGTVAIRAQYNVSSITDNGVGDYTVNFTTAMVDANYAAVTGLSIGSPGGSYDGSASIYSAAGVTTSSVRVFSSQGQVAGQGEDAEYFAVAIFR